MTLISEVLVLETRGMRGLDDMRSQHILKKHAQLFHKNFENEASTISPWDPIIVCGFNYDKDKESPLPALSSSAV